MRVIQFDSKNYPHIHSNIGHLIRFGYVLSNYLGSIGLSTTVIAIEYHFYGQSIENQISILRELKNLEDEYDIMDYYLREVKLFKKIKRPDKEDIVRYRKAEALVKKVVKEWIENKIQYQHDCGMGNIFKLIKNFKCDFFHSTSVLEANFPKTRNLYSLDLLANKSIQKHVNNNIWLFPGDFLNDEIASLIIDYPNTESISNHYLIEACTLPNLFSYSNQELIASANMFHNKCYQFQLLTEEWTKQCYAGGGRAYFKESIYPLVPNLQPAFDEDALVNYKKNIDEDKTTHTLFIGEVSPIHIWKYYKELENEVEKEIELLINNYLENGKEHTIPVFVFKQSTTTSIENNSAFENEQTDDTDKPVTENEMELLGFKKHLNIDDL